VPDFDVLVRAYEAQNHDLDLIMPSLLGGQNYPGNFHSAALNEDTPRRPFAASAAKSNAGCGPATPRNTKASSPRAKKSA
jgi:hypothetical protein